MTPRWTERGPQARRSLYVDVIARPEATDRLIGVFTALLTLGWTYDDLMDELRPLLLEINSDPHRDHEYDIVADALDPIAGWCAPEYRIHPPSGTTTATTLAPAAVWELIDRVVMWLNPTARLEGAIRLLVVEGADARVLVERLGDVANRMASEGRSE